MTFRALPNRRRIDTKKKMSMQLMLPYCGHHLLLLFMTLILVPTHTETTTSGTVDGSESWGYVDVRPGAHMFWWLYKNQVLNNNSNARPLVLWLQGGPGASGVGIGNFIEIGPLNQNLQRRKETWLTKADLLFLDSPVGTGYSYVDNTSLIPSNDVDVAQDLLATVKGIFEAMPKLYSAPLFIVGESYGGKHACLLGLALSKAIANGELKINLGGVALGDSWISPVDFVLSWGPQLKSMSRVDGSQERTILRLAKAIETLVDAGGFVNATSAWAYLEGVVTELSNNVDFYNMLNDASEADTATTTTTSTSLLMSNAFTKFNRYYQKKFSRDKVDSQLNLESIMNGPIREKLKIIPTSQHWVESSGIVFGALRNVFMKDVIEEVDELLSLGVNVTIYNGQLDLICATIGTESWVQKLKWPGLEAFTKAQRKPIMSCGVTTAFVTTYENLSFYWILLAGHMVPLDQPTTALDMLTRITS